MSQATAERMRSCSRLASDTAPGWCSPLIRMLKERRRRSGAVRPQRVADQPQHKVAAQRHEMPAEFQTRLCGFFLAHALAANVE